jgi:hypothetical protein
MFELSIGFRKKLFGEKNGKLNVQKKTKTFNALVEILRNFVLEEISYRI